MSVPSKAEDARHVRYPEVTGLVGRYLELGLRLGRHINGLVDAYYGPQSVGHRVSKEPLLSPGRLREDARRLLSDLQSGLPLDGGEADVDVALAKSNSADSLRRHWIFGQTEGLLTTARILCAEPIEYRDEVELCYGVRPKWRPEEELSQAHSYLDQVLPGSGQLAERFSAWRDSHIVPPALVEPAVRSLSEDLRSRCSKAFGLPSEESVEFELVANKPWSGFNYYLGDLRSRVAINTDLPILSTSLAHLVAHETYPGHHTEHCLKEVGLVNKHQQWEESIFLVGTPQCLMAEGLADLGLEVLLGSHPESLIAEHLRPLGVPYDTDTIAVVSQASEVLSAARGNAALRLHEDHADPETVSKELAYWGLLSPERAKKSVQFLLDPTWRAYITCYIEGLPLCRAFVKDQPDRFERLLREQLLPVDIKGGE